MLVACVPLLVALLVGLPSTVTAQPLDHQQLDISVVIETNPASPDYFRGKHLSKHPNLSVKVPPMLDEKRSNNFHNPEKVKSHRPDSFFDNYELETRQLYSGMTSRVLRASNIGKISVNADNSSFPCPASDTITPCTCELTSASQELNLNCSDVESLEQMAEVFMQYFPVKEFYMLQIWNNFNIQYLTDVFNGVSFTYISLFNLPNLAEISNYAFFDSLNSLVTMYIYTSALDENTFPFSTLDQFSRLSYLRIAESNFSYWPVFSSLTLKAADFRVAHISALPSSKKQEYLAIEII